MDETLGGLGLLLALALLLFYSVKQLFFDIYDAFKLPSIKEKKNLLITSILIKVTNFSVAFAFIISAAIQNIGYLLLSIIPLVIILVIILQISRIVLYLAIKKSNLNSLLIFSILSFSMALKILAQTELTFRNYLGLIYSILFISFSINCFKLFNYNFSKKITLVE